MTHTCIGLHSEKHPIYPLKNDKQRHQAVHIEDDSAVSLDVHNHLWDAGGHGTNVSQG